jgi:hypothetical protein
MTGALPPMRRRSFLKGLGLGLVAAPGFSLLSSRATAAVHGKTPVINLQGPMRNK